MSILLHPYALVSYALLFSHGWAFVQGKHYEQRAEFARVETTNIRIREVNAREETLAAKEAAERQNAFSAAEPILAKADKCVATPDVARALSAIK